MSAETREPDTAIRALIASVAQATVELVVEHQHEIGNAGVARRIASRKAESVETITNATMECAEDDPESEVHAVRVEAAHAERVQELEGALRELVDDIERWEDAVRSVIKVDPTHGMDLARARRALGET